MTTKQELHRIVDELPGSVLPEAKRRLESLRAADDPVLQAILRAPVDDEPETEEERAATREARDALARGETFTLDEVRRELGL